MNTLTEYKIPIILSIISVALALGIYLKSPGGKFSFDRFALQAPVIGEIVRHHYIGLFCRTTSMLLASGLPLPVVMDVAIRATGNNRLFLRALVRIREKLIQGEGLAGPMSQEMLFPAMTVRMVKIGELTGTLDSTLLALAKHYECRANQRIQSLVALIEPVLTITLGIFIAFIAISMIMPIYSIMNNVG